MAPSSFAVLSAVLVVLVRRADSTQNETECLNSLVKWCQGTMLLGTQCVTGYADSRHTCTLGGYTIGCQLDNKPWIRCEKGFLSHNRLLYKGREAKPPLTLDSDVCASSRLFIDSLLPGLAAKIHSSFLSGLEGVEAGQRALQSTKTVFDRLAQMLGGLVNLGLFPVNNLALDPQKQNLARLCRECMAQLNAGTKHSSKCQAAPVASPFNFLG